MAKIIEADILEFLEEAENAIQKVKHQMFTEDSSRNRIEIQTNLAKATSALRSSLDCSGILYPVPRD